MAPPTRIEPVLLLCVVVAVLRRRAGLKAYRVNLTRPHRRLLWDPLLLTASAWALWRSWRWWLDLTDEPPPAKLQMSAQMSSTPAVEPRSHSPRPVRHRNSFTITNERGESRGSLGDEATDGWGWQVDESPVTAMELQKRPEPVLRRDSSESRLERRHSSATGEAYPVDGAAAKPARSKVRFQLDQSPGFYGFVFGYDGLCVAHGADERFAGLTLAQVMERSQIGHGSLKGEDLHRRFVAAAEAGGGWVSYTARNPEPSRKPEPGPDLA